MLYKDFKGLKLSALGYGCMRLPVLDGDNTKIDEALAEELLDKAFDMGVNYFDTAYGYHGGNSERVVGRALKKHPRESYYLASKFPSYDVSFMDKVTSIFPEQLEKTGHDYFDFYLLHNVSENNLEKYLAPDCNVVPYLTEMKAQGKIRHLGFSTHASVENMKRFLDRYGADMEFGQIQLNWLDWEFQDAKGKVELLKSYGIPVWVMEPLRGGKLINLSCAQLNSLKTMKPEFSAAEWCFRFLQSVPEVKVVLSGMNSEAQLLENLKIFEEEKPLSSFEQEKLFAIAKELTQSVPCTGCRYCTEHCPQGIDIPLMIKLYNEHKYTLGIGNFAFIAPRFIGTLAEGKKPADCRGCRACEKLCPQGLKISEILKDFSKLLEVQNR